MYFGVLYVYSFNILVILCSMCVCVLQRHRAEGTIGSTGNSSGWCSNMEKLVVPLATKRRLLTGYLEKMVGIMLIYVPQLVLFTFLYACIMQRKEFVLSDIEASKRVHAIVSTADDMFTSTVVCEWMCMMLYSMDVHEQDCEYTPEDVKDMLSGKLIKDKTAGESHDKKRPFFNMFQ